MPKVFTFRIVSSGHIGTMKQRYTQGTLHITSDPGEAKQLRSSSSAMEIKNEGPTSAPEEAQVAEAQAEVAPPTKASVREQMMDNAKIPWARLKAMAKDRGINIHRKGREFLVDAILEATDE